MSFLMGKSRLPSELLRSGFLARTLDGALGVQDDLRPGFTYLVDGNTFEPVQPVLEFLLATSRAGKGSLATNKNRADHLYEWLMYLDELGIGFESARMEQVVEYASRMSGYVSLITRQTLSDGTIAGRIGTVVAFHQWAQKARWLPTGSFPENTPSQRGYGRTYPTRAGPTVSSQLVPKKRGKLIEFINVNDLRRIMTALRDPKDGSKSTRDYLISLFMLTTAARIFETLALTVAQMHEFLLRAERTLERDPREPTEKLTLVVTKGGAPRDIDVPLEVIRAIICYIDGERAKAVAAGVKSGTISRDHGLVFVNGTAAPDAYVGRPYQQKRAEERFVAAQLEIGLVRTVSVMDPGTRMVAGTKDRAMHVPHHLRHTWTVHAWNGCRHLPEADRWIRLQHQLGHASHRVTADTYLRAVRRLDTSSRQTYVDFLKVLADAPA